MGVLHASIDISPASAIILREKHTIAISCCENVCTDPRKCEDVHVRKPGSRSQTSMLLLLYSMTRSANVQSKRYRIALFHFLGRRYEESLRWINEILNQPQNTYRNDIQSSVRLLNLLVHHELGNFDLLPNYVRSYYRFLKSKSRLFKTELIILTFIRRLSGVITPKDLREEYGRAYNELQLAQANDPLERSALAYFDLAGWLESKRFQKPVMDVKQRSRSTSFGEA